MPEPRYYRIVLWSLVLFVLVVATPGWYIQKRMAQKMYRLEERVAGLEQQVEELKSRPTDGRAGDKAVDAGDEVPREPAEESNN